MKLYQRLRNAPSKSPARSIADFPLSMDGWAGMFGFNGLQYPFGIQQTYTGTPGETIEANFQGYVQAAYKRNGIVFACMLVRMLLFSEARFQFQAFNAGRPGKLFGTSDLRILEQPWTNATTGDLLTRMIQDADLAGNFYGHRTLDAAGRPTIVRRRPDWVTIVLGSKSGQGADAADAEIIGYVYQPGGPKSDLDPVVMLPEMVAHFAPIPDPMARYRGISWLTPVVSEILGDDSMITHKQKFFDQGATGNMVITLGGGGLDDLTPEQFDAWVDKFDGSHEGLLNAYRTIYLAAGADAKVVGADMKQMDFKEVQGHGETRIAAAAGTPPILVGLSEGLASATYSNYASARRRFADGTMRPLWRNAAGSLETLVTVPPAARLWYDSRDVAFLQEDVKDQAEIQQIRSQSIRTLVDAGFTAESVIAAVTSSDESLLVHSGLFSVQLQLPGATEIPSPASNGKPVLPVASQ